MNYPKSKLLIIIVLGLLLGLSSVANAQNLRKGKLINKSNEVIPYVTIQLVDSAQKIIDYAISDERGEFQIQLERPNAKQLQITAVGYEKLIQEIATLESSNPLVLMLNAASQTSIQTITVTGRKPTVEAKLGKTIFNVENTPLVQTSSAIDLLGKAPGVFVDMQQESVKLQGKKVLFLVDGKRTYLEGNQVYQYLNNFQGGTIEKIELIHSPSAKYEAAAVINIITKKDKSHGWNTVLSTTAGYGQQPDVKGSGTFNYRNQKIAFSTSLGANFDKSPVQGTTEQRADNYSLFQAFHSLSKNNSSYGKFSLDYFLNKKNTLGLVYSKNTGNKLSDQLSESQRNELANGLKIFNDHNTGDVHHNRDLLSFNYTNTFSESSKLMFNSDYAWSNNLGDNRYQTSLNQQVYRDRLNNLDLDNKVLSMTLDYEDLLWKKYALEVGAKLTDIQTDNFNRFETLTDSQNQIPTLQEDKFQYSENVTAAYLDLSTAFSEKFSAQLGLRAEHTQTTGKSISTNLIHKQSYFDLLPKVNLNYALNKNHNLSLGYSRSIDRPSFRTLNPFRYYSDIYSASEGNPYLKPSYTQSIALQHFFKSKYMFTLAYMENRGDHNVYYDRDEDVIVSKYENYGLTSAWMASAYIPVAFTKWWNSTLQVQVAQLNIRKDDFQKSGPAFSFNSSSSFKLPKKYMAELSHQFSYTSTMGIYEVAPIYSFNVSFSKSFLNNQLAAKIQGIDLFSLYRWHAKTIQNGIFYENKNRGRGAMYFLSLTYKLGKTTVKGSTAKSKAIENDQDRMN